MSDTVTTQQEPKKRGVIAFFPFTFGGVARFGKTNRSFLFSVQVLVAVATMFCVLTFFCSCYFPVINGSIQKLPQDSVGIQNGELHWNIKGKLLDQNKFLAITVDESGQAVGAESDCLISITKDRLRIANNCGYHSLIPYPRDFSFSLNKNDIYPWWLAWRIPMLFLIAIASILSLFIVWQVLSAIYSPLIKGIAWVYRKKITWSGAYALAGAALMPGAVIMCLSIVGYTGRLYSLEGLVIAMPLHLIVGWVFLLISPFFLEKAPKKIVLPKPKKIKDVFKKALPKEDKKEKTPKPARVKGNPFAEAPKKVVPKKKKSKNPFSI